MGYTKGSLSVDDILDALQIFNWDVTRGLYKVEAGTWAISAQALAYLGQYLQNSTDTQNDEINIGAFHIPAATTYTFYIISEVNTSSGIVHVMLNDVSSGTVDLYNATPADNDILSGSLGTLTKGIKVICLKMATKNGASSAYNMKIQACGILKT